METELKQKVVKGTFWALLERFATQFVSFGVTLVLARLLTPENYGVVALLSIFITLAGVLADSGFGQALVQKKNATDVDFCSVFYLSLALASILYAVLFFTAPLIATFYRSPDLVPLVRVMALVILFNAISSVQDAELNRKMLFDKSFRIGMIRCAVAASVGLGLALAGMGAWALVGSQVLAAFAGVTARWFIIAWRPKRLFSMQALAGLFRFGWKMTLSTLLNAFYENLYGLIIGKIYSKADLAFVNKGQQPPQLSMDAINGTLGRVSFPALSQMQDEPEKMRQAMRRMIQCSMFLVLPMMAGCAACAPLVIPVLFGEQWLPSIPYAQVACFSVALWPFHTINLQGITALGRSDVFLKLEIVKKVLGLFVLILSYRYGVFVFVCVGAFVMGPLGVVINAWPNRRLLGYTIGMQLRDVASSACVSLAMGGIVWTTLRCLPVPEVMLLRVLFLAGGILEGVLLYASFAYVFRLRPLGEYARILIPRLASRFPRLGIILRRCEQRCA